MIIFEGDRSEAAMHAGNGAHLHAEFGENSPVGAQRNCFRVATGPGRMFDEAGCREAAQFFQLLADELEARNRPRRVTVRRGDTLWDLAQLYLGDPTRWPELFDLNRDTILTLSRGPDLIHPGTVLTIPSP